MDIKELKNMDKSRLEELQAEKRHEIYKLKLKFSVNNTGNVRKLRKAKKDLAQLLTIIKQKKKHAKQEATS